MSRSFAITLLLYAALFGVCLLRYAPPAVRGLETPTTEFSAARAGEIQRAIAGSGASRTIGSERNAKARVFLEGELGKAGWKTEIQSAMSCTPTGACARVKNVVATRSGTDPSATAVLLMAHYDSVTCSPGASDDGFGTSAVVEAARAIAAGPPLRRTVIVVLTDGEEAGPLGADAFAHQHPLAPSVRGVVNVDARGSRGPSTMFETSAGNGYVVGLLARNVDRPVTSSLFYEVYRRMPNDTDFTAVKGLAHGVNFANIAGVEHYHTPLDTIANADPRTLQHHGDQALAMVRAFASAGPELDAPRSFASDAVWFDVLASFIVRWPAAASLGLALTALALVLGWTLRLRAWRSGLRGFAAPLASLVAALLGAIAMGGALQALGALPVPWVAHPLPALISLHGTCILAGLAAARLAAGKASTEAVWAGTWLTWGVLGVAAAVVAPGASFLFVVPTLAAGLVAWLRIDLAAVIPAVVAAVLWLPIMLLVYDGLGLVVPVLACLSSVFLVTTLPALWLRDAGGDAETAKVTRRRVSGAAVAVALVAAVVALLVPRYSVAIPQRVNVVFRQDNPRAGAAAPPARVYVEAAWGYVPWGKPPEPMLHALGKPQSLPLEEPWVWSSPVPVAEVARVSLPAPTAVVLAPATQDGPGATTRVRLVSPRGASTIAILLPPGTRVTIAVDGQSAIPQRGAVIVRGVSREGLEVVFTRDGRAPVAVTILDVAPGLPEDAPIARAVESARPAEAVQTQEGDITIMATSLDL